MKLKKLKRNDFIIILLVGVMILVVAIPTAPKSSQQTFTTKTETAHLETTNTDEEKLKDALEQIEGVGKTQVMITRDKEENVMGVLIVTQGADNLVIKEQITEATSALFGIDLHKIVIVKMNSGEE